MHRLSTAATTALLFLAHGPAGAQGQAPEGYDAIHAQYKRYRTTEPLAIRTIGRERLASTGDPRALEILIDDFSSPESPKQVVRHLLASVTTRHFAGADSVERLAEWREEHDKPLDAWLWLRTLKIDAEQAGPEASLAVIQDRKASIYHKAAALEALARCEDPKGLYGAVALVMENLPKKPYEKAVLVGGMATALEHRQGKIHDRAYKSSLSYFIHLLDEEYGLETDTKLVIARHLGRILNTDELVINSAPWVAKLADTSKKVTRGSEAEYVRPTFFGVEATGSRICYVIDMSDSMCKPVDAPGRGAEEDSIVLDQVETRFDLAREHLKLSLRQLGKDKSFAVVYFGDQAGLLDSCKGMVKATPGNVKKVIKELDSIETDKPTEMRPDGRLRGKTNLHGGLRSAFRVQKKGLVDEGSYVDLDVFAEGADTIFLLSDGRPSWDDYEAWDVDYGEFTIGDPESGQKGGGGNRMHYGGPYRDTKHLLEDVERLNAFRELEIHCIAIGREAPRQLLQKIADLGHGKLHELAD
ncbi:MAG: hypothetical protein AAF682_27445 [Planctomycetota bacterium]